MPKRDPLVRLRHMRDYTREALEMAAGRSRSDLDSDRTFALALTHLVELVGEAAAQVPQAIRDKYPRIPWPKVVGMRNRLIHGYDYVDYDILWDAVQLNLPVLLKALKEALQDERSD